MTPRVSTVAALIVTLHTTASVSSELMPNQWVKLENATIGQRSRGAIFYSPETKRFMVMGGIPESNAKGDQPYDDLALDLEAGLWENWYPAGKSFGPKFGPCKPPKFAKRKGYGDPFTDIAGHNRSNFKSRLWRWVYGCSAYDPHSRKLTFYGGGVSSESSGTAGPAWGARRQQHLPTAAPDSTR